MCICGVLNIVSTMSLAAVIFIQNLTNNALIYVYTYDVRYVHTAQVGHTHTSTSNATFSSTFNVGMCFY